MNVSFFDIQRVKREAKKLRSLTPLLNHSSALSEAAKALFGVRSFHELNKLREHTINRHLVGDGQLVTCTFCGLNFCPDIAEDRKTHRERHDAYEEATTVLGYTPRQHADREALKKSGYELASSPNPEEALTGVLMVARGWFDRSLDSAIDGKYWRQHPSFNEYVSYISGDLDQFPVVLTDKIQERYGRKDGVIPKGRSYWYPPKKNSV